jgi:16S rRNA (guanine527-N7)-methyltransferase
MVQGRAEELSLHPPHRAGYDLVLARAVAPLPTLVEYLLPLARRGGQVVAYKGSAAPEEALAAEHAIQILGGHLRRLVPMEVPGLAETRVLVIIDKVSQTPEGYPRGQGLPRKQPLGGNALPNLPAGDEGEAEQIQAES